MTDPLLTVQVTDHAQDQVSTLTEEDRRQVLAWFDHLRNWHNDEFLRSKARRLDTTDDTYVLPARGGLLIAFQLVADEVVVLSIFREEHLRAFAASATVATR